MGKEDSKLKLAIIAGATQAIKYLEQNKRATYDEALRHVANNTQEALSKIDLE